METIVKQVELMKISLQPDEVLMIKIISDDQVEMGTVKQLVDGLVKQLGVDASKVAAIVSKHDIQFTAIKPAPEGTDHG